MPCAAECARNAAALLGSHEHVWHVLLRPAIAFRPKASTLPVSAAKALIAAQRSIVRQKSVAFGSGGHGVVGVS